MRECKGIVNGRFQIKRTVDTPDTLAAGAVHRLYDAGQGKVSRRSQSCRLVGIAVGPGDSEAVIPQKGAKTSLVLQNAGGFIGAGGGKIQLFGHIGRRYNAGIAGKAHHAVDLKLPCRLQYGVLVEDADVEVLIAELVGGVVGEVVAGDHMDPQHVRFPNHRAQIA